MWKWGEKSERKLVCFFSPIPPPPHKQRPAVVKLFQKSSQTNFRLSACSLMKKSWPTSLFQVFFSQQTSLSTRNATILWQEKKRIDSSLLLKQPCHPKRLSWQFKQKDHSLSSSSSSSFIRKRQKMTRCALALSTQDCLVNNLASGQCFSSRSQYTLEPVGFRLPCHQITRNPGNFHRESLPVWSKTRTTRTLWPPACFLPCKHSLDCAPPLTHTHTQNVCTYCKQEKQPRKPSHSNTHSPRVPNHFWPESGSLVNSSRKRGLSSILHTICWSRLAVKQQPWTDGKNCLFPKWPSALLVSLSFLRKRKLQKDRKPQDDDKRAVMSSESKC